VVKLSIPSELKPEQVTAKPAFGVGSEDNLTELRLLHFWRYG